MIGKTPLFILLLLLITIGKISAQQLIIIDAKSSTPVSGALVQISDQQLISNKEGIIIIKSRNNQVVRINHINYVPFEKEIYFDENKNITLRLTPKTNQLEEVIVTGQFYPQSIDKTVFSAKTIDAVAIEQQGSIDLADALRNTLNLTISPNKGAGTSEINMLGLDGAYVKVLIDGIPMVNINGNGNNADISQIDMSQIERIEIVEGPMAVSYGANATAGVVNLISKSNKSDKINIEAYVQEETVGNEYGKGKGRHLQNVSVLYNFNDKWGIHAKVRRLRFNGFWKDYKGFDHPLDDDKRGFDWNPKKQLNWTVGTHYQWKNAILKYVYKRFSQQLDIPSKKVNENEHTQTKIKNPYANGDWQYNDLRQVHQLILEGKIKDKIKFSNNSAYSTIDREELKLTKYIITKQESVNQTTNSHYKAMLSRGTFSSFMPSDSPIDFQLGYEWNYDQIRASNLRSGNLEKGATPYVTKSINDLAFFLNTEWNVTDRLMLRPGIRTYFNSHFDNSWIYSLNTKYAIPDVIDIRLSAGRSYRTPNLTELYYYFVDANHDIQGNSELSPEDGYGLSLDLKRTSRFDQLTVTTSGKAFYNDIKGKISTGVVSKSPLRFQSLNINRYRSKGISLDNKLLFKNFTGQIGIGYIGFFNKINTEDIEQPDEFLYSTDFNANISYQIEKPNISIGVYYKHTGAREQFQLVGVDYKKKRVSEFDWLNASVTWKPIKSISFQAGVKNLLNIIDLSGSLSAAGAHSSASTTTGMSYGRSYFVRLQYSFVN